MARGIEKDLPLARSENLVTQVVDDEILVYDRLSNEAHCLSPLAAAVFAAADGRTAVDELARIAGARLEETVDVPAVERALAELDERDLLAASAAGQGYSRGRFLRKAAVATAAVPLVASVATPAYGGASSPAAGSLSYVAAAFEVSGTIYWMKWEILEATGLPKGAPECGSTMSLPACTLSPSATTDSCLVGANVSENLTTHEVTFTIPTGAKLVDFALKCGNTCVKPGTNGNDLLPSGGASGPTYTTKGC